MQTNRALMQVALALAAIGACALVLTASSDPGTTVERAIAGIFIVTFAAVNLLAVALPPSVLRNVLLYVAATLQLLISLFLTTAFLLVGSVTSISGIISGLPGGDLLASGSLLTGVGAIALAIFAVVAIGLGLSIARRDPGLLRDAVAMSIVGLLFILPVVVAVALFLLVQVFAATQDATIRDVAAIASAVLMAAAGIAALAALALGVLRAERRGVLVGISATLLGLGILGGLLASGLLFYIGIGAAALGWLLILAVRGRQMAFGWVGILIVLGAAGLLTLISSVTAGHLAVIMLPVALVALVAAASQSTLISKGAPAGLAGLSSVVVVIAGTMNNGSGTGVIDPSVASIALGMFIVAAAFAAASWVIAIIEAARIKAWGWLVATVVFLSVGALLFGLFGPTAEDVRQTRQQKQQRRAAGLA